MIWLVGFLELLFLILAVVCGAFAETEDNLLLGFLSLVFIVALIIFPIAFGELHGYINYIESNDKDKARITAVTQEQDFLKTYYKVEVEYLTNTPTQSGIVTNYNIEKDS